MVKRQTIDDLGRERKRVAQTEASVKFLRQEQAGGAFEVKEVTIIMEGALHERCQQVGVLLCLRTLHSENDTIQSIGGRERRSEAVVHI